MKVSLISLGCAKNEVDSEEILGLLAGDGHSVEWCQSPSGVQSGTDVVIVNTCGFIEDARQESIDTILEALQRKQSGEVGKVVVCGCMAQRYGAELPHELPEVDAFIGTGGAGAVRNVVGDNLIRPGQIVSIAAKPHHTWIDSPTRVRLGSPWSAYLKISEGCDHKCTFCAIPSFRGPHVSKPIEKVVAEAEQLASGGVKELNLIAQDSTQYGHDLYGRARLTELLKELSRVEEIRWIRLFYCYPSRVTQELMETIAGTPKICHYIDMPLQHADDTMLRAMRRPMSYQRYIELIARFRRIIPDVSIRTTFIVGFPGETREQFATLERFVDEAQLDRVGVFEYSLEAGTPSAEMPGRVGSRVRRMRKDSLLGRQQEVSLARNREWIGRTMDVLVESRSALDPSSVVGRSFRDAPEIDGSVRIRRCAAKPGDYVQARIVEAKPYDLVGVSA